MERQRQDAAARSTAQNSNAINLPSYQVLPAGQRGQAGMYDLYSSDGRGYLGTFASQEDAKNFSRTGSIITDKNVLDDLDYAREIAAKNEWTENERNDAQAIYDAIKPRGIFNDGSLGQWWNDQKYMFTHDPQNASVWNRVQNGDLKLDWQDTYSTYTEKNGFLTGDMQYTIGRASARIPGIDFQQIPYIDAWGRVEETGNLGEWAFNNFLNPAYTSTVEESETEKELLRLYRETGEAGVLPKRAAKYFTVNGERKDLTAEEYVAYATKKGQLSRELIDDLLSSKDYKAMSDAEKVKAIQNAYDYANQTAKAAVSEYSGDSWVEKANEAQEKYHIPQQTYINLKTKAAGIASIKDKDGNTIPNSKSLLIMQMVYNTPGLNETQRKAMFSYLGVGKTVLHYNKAKVEEELGKMRKKAA